MLDFTKCLLPLLGKYLGDGDALGLLNIRVHIYKRPLEFFCHHAGEYSLSRSHHADKIHVIHHTLYPPDLSSSMGCIFVIA